MELYETIEETAIRELKEEAGITKEIDKVTNKIKDKFNNDKSKIDFDKGSLQTAKAHTEGKDVFGGYTFINKYDISDPSLVTKVNDDKSEVDDFVRFLLNDAQEFIEKQGFTPMG